MAKTKTIRTAWAVALLLAVLPLLAVRAMSREPITVREVDHLIRDQLPLGSDKEAVTRFAIAHGWSCSDVMGPDAPERKPTKFNEYHAPGLIYAKTDGWNEWIIYYCWIDLYFLLDKHGKLTRYSVVKAVEGP